MSTSVAANPALLVIGGGVSGMAAALVAAECSRQVLRSSAARLWVAARHC